MQEVRSDPQTSGQSDEGVFCAAYREFSPAVLSYLRARGVEDPEGTTQEVFLALHPQLADVHGGLHGIKSLVFSIAHAPSTGAASRPRRPPATTPKQTRALTRLPRTRCWQRRPRQT
jgi:RNA polymerase sigma-70 factor, ECF subfamily